jgi:hypothetical protein
MVADLTSIGSTDFRPDPRHGHHGSKNLLLFPLDGDGCPTAAPISDHPFKPPFLLGHLFENAFMLRAMYAT